MNKKRKYAYAAMTSTVLVIVLVIIANLIVVSLSGKVNLKMDLTRDKILSFSDETKEVLDSLEMDVEIISLFPQDVENSDTTHLDEIIKRYVTSSDKIKYQRIDAKKNPGVLRQYSVNGEPLKDAYNIIVKTDRMYSVIPDDDLFSRITYNNMNYAQTANIWAEQCISSAILKVTKGSNINCYVVTGHGGDFDGDKFSKEILPGTGYNFKSISLTKSEIPDDAHVIVIASPSNDLSIEEIAKLDAFMAKGGNLQVFVGAQTQELPVLFEYLAEWGIEVRDGVVADENSYLSTFGTKSVIAEIPQNDITQKLINKNMDTIIFRDSRPLGKVSPKGQWVGSYVSEIATTSDDGYVKKNKLSVVDAFEAGDKKEKANVAFMSENVIDEKTVARVYVSGSVNFFDPAAMLYNSVFYSNIMAYMTDQPSLYIVPKVVIQSDLAIKHSTAYLYSLLVIVVIPVIIMAVGFIIWIRRSHL